MNILIDIGHPGHVHLYRNIYFVLVNKGHNLFVTTQDLKSARVLLDSYDIPYDAITIKGDSVFKKGLAMLKNTQILYKYARNNKIDIGISSTPSLMQALKLLNKQGIFMDDDDDPVEPFVRFFAHPFCSTVLSPNNTIRNTSKNIYYHGYHELAYLHPNFYKPNPDVFRLLKIEKDTPFYILRFVALKGHHDRNEVGLSENQKKEIVIELSKFGKVFITSESDINDWFKPYQLKIPYKDIHSILSYASLFVGDSQTMTSEAAVLGTPALRCNSFVNRITYLKEEEEKYLLTYGFHPNNFIDLLDKIKSLVSNDNLKEIWDIRKGNLLNDKIDVTSFMVWFIENYPESKKIMKENPNYQYKFK